MCGVQNRHITDGGGLLARYDRVGKHAKISYNPFHRVIVIFASLVAKVFGTGEGVWWQAFV